MPDWLFHTFSKNHCVTSTKSRGTPFPSNARLIILRLNQLLLEFVKTMLSLANNKIVTLHLHIADS